MSHTSKVTLIMIYFTTWEVMFTPGDSDVYMTINQLKPRLHYAIYAASNIRNRRSTSLAIRIAGCVRVYTGRRCAEVGVALPCERKTSQRSCWTRPWLLRRNMLRAWMVDANFIFILVSISSYVSFSFAYIRLFHPMHVFFTSLLIFIMFIRDYRPLILLLLFLHPDFGLTML